MIIRMLVHFTRIFAFSFSDSTIYIPGGPEYAIRVKIMISILFLNLSAMNSLIYIYIYIRYLSKRSRRQPLELGGIPRQAQTEQGRSK